MKATKLAEPGVAKDKVTIVYDMMHHSTGLMARTLAEGIKAEGVAVKVCPLKDGRFERTHQNNDNNDIFDSKAMLVGSPTRKGVADFLRYLQGIQSGGLDAKKIGFAFGSHDRHGSRIKIINEELTKAGVEVINDGYAVLWKPDAVELTKCYELGQEVARRVKAM
jgi:hypothetical protein